MTNTNIQALEKMIVKNAVNDKPCRGLLIAYCEEFEALCEEEDKDAGEMIAVVESREECERIMAEEYISPLQVRPRS